MCRPATLRGSGFVAPLRNPRRRHKRATAPKRSGWRGTSTSKSAGTTSRSSANASSSLPSSPLCVLAAIQTGRAPPQCSRSSRPCSSRCAGSSTSNFKLPVTSDELLRSAEVAQPLSVGPGLRAEQIGMHEHCARRLWYAQIAAQRCLRNSAVDEQQRNATLAARGKNIRPELGLRDHRDFGVHALEKASHGVRKIVRHVAMVNTVAEELAHLLGSRRCHRGDDEPMLRVAVDERLDQRRRRAHLTNRHRVHPDDAPSRADARRNRNAPASGANTPDSARPRQTRFANAYGRRR